MHGLCVISCCTCKTMETVLNTKHVEMHIKQTIFTPGISICSHLASNQCELIFLYFDPPFRLWSKHFPFVDKY